MNYYEHHIGDYAQATAHLSYVEDAAYSRLIRKYYAEEKPLPADIKAVQRLVGARTKEERQAVADMLGEFFELESDGWHNKRCDAEIARYRDKQDKARASAEARWSKRNADAMRTHCETDANASTGGDANAMRTHCEGNAHQAPDTRHQTPDPSLQPASTALTAVGARASPGDLSGEMRKAGIQSNPSDPRIIALAERGVTRETVAAACDEAKAAKPGERISPGYVIAIADRWAKKADDIKGANGQAPSARASPQRKTAAQERAEVSAVLTGRGKANERDERDITGESVRIA